MRVTDYRQRILYQKKIDDLVNDSNKGIFATMATAPTNIKPVFLNRFTPAYLDLLFESYGSERWLNRYASNAYDIINDKLVIKSDISNIIYPIAELYKINWDNIYDGWTMKYNPIENTDRYESHRDGYYFDDNNNMVADSVVSEMTKTGTETQTISGSEKDSHAINKKSTAPTQNIISEDYTYSDDLQTDYKKHYTETVNIKDGSNGSITEVTTNEKKITKAVDGSKEQSSDETLTNGFNGSASAGGGTGSGGSLNASGYSPEQKILHEKIPVSMEEITESSGTGPNQKTVEKQDKTTTTEYTDANSGDTESKTGSHSVNYGYSTVNGSESASASDNYDLKEYTDRHNDITYNNRKDTQTQKGAYLIHSHGNIGVTTNQQMLQSEIDLRQYNFIKQIFDDVLNALTLKIY